MGGDDHSEYCPMWKDHRIAELEAENAALRKEIEGLKEAAFSLYCNGYENGHNDTVESSYTPPSEYPEDFPEILTEIMAEAFPEGDDK